MFEGSKFFQDTYAYKHWHLNSFLYVRRYLYGRTLLNRTEAEYWLWPDNYKYRNCLGFWTLKTKPTSRPSRLAMDACCNYMVGFRPYYYGTSLNYQTDASLFERCKLVRWYISTTIRIRTKTLVTCIAAVMFQRLCCQKAPDTRLAHVNCGEWLDVRVNFFKFIQVTWSQTITCILHNGLPWICGCHEIILS